MKSLEEPGDCAKDINRQLDPEPNRKLAPRVMFFADGSKCPPEPDETEAQGKEVECVGRPPREKCMLCRLRWQNDLQGNVSDTC
jgi:hypothetical protein